MKDIIFNPVIIAFICATFSMSFFLLFTYVSSNKKRASLGETLLVGLFIFTISGATGVTLSPFSKLHPLVFYAPKTSASTIVGNLSFYFIVSLILSSRLRYTLKDLVEVIIKILISDIALTCLLLIIGLSTFWSDTPIYTLKVSLTYLVTAIAAIYVGKQYSWKDLYKISRWVGLFIVIFSFIQTNRDGEGHWTGILGHKNQFSFFMAQTAVLWMLYAIYNPKKRRISLVIFILAVIGLQGGGSGASKVISVVLLALWAYLGLVKKLPFQWAFSSVVLFMIVGISLTIVVTENIHYIVVDTLHKDMSLTGRLDFWPQLIDKINERPLLGYGAGGFWQPWREADDPGGHIIVAKTQFKPPHSHNGLLDMALEVGYVGVALYLITFVTNIAKGVLYLGRAKEPESVLPILLLTYIIMTNITEVGMFGATSEWFWFVAITVRLNLDTTGNKRTRAT